MSVNLNVKCFGLACSVVFCAVLLLSPGSVAADQAEAAEVLTANPELATDEAADESARETLEAADLELKSPDHTTLQGQDSKVKPADESTLEADAPEAVAEMQPAEKVGPPAKNGGT